MRRLFFSPRARGGVESSLRREATADRGASAAAAASPFPAGARSWKEKACEQVTQAASAASREKERINSVAFNQDASCVALATSRGFVIYSTEPLQKTFARDLTNDFWKSSQAWDPGLDEQTEKGLLIAEMLFTCNILALVGSQPSALYWPKRLREDLERETRWSGDACVLWDDRQEKVIAQLQFHSPIRGVQLLEEVLLVMLTEKLCVYRLRDLLLLDTISTAPDPGAICAAASLPSFASASSSSSSFSSSSFSRKDQSSGGLGLSSHVLVACPALQTGQVQLLVYGEDPGAPAHCSSSLGSADSATSDSSRRTTAATPLISSIAVCAHTNALAFLCLSSDGALLGTASARGTLLRVFSAKTGDFLMEFRRGSNPASITSMSFSPDLRFLAACSGTGTTHVYRLSTEAACDGASRPPASRAGGGEPHASSRSEAARESPKEGSKSGFFGALGPYFQHQWSFAQWRLPSKDCAAICAFAQHERDTLYVISAEGHFYKLRLDPVNGGVMTKVLCESLLPP